MTSGKTLLKTKASLPTFDLSRFRGPPEGAAPSSPIFATCSMVTVFFYLTGHVVDPKLIENVMTTAKRFFALPLEEKLKIEMVKSPYFRGYNRAG